MDSFDDNSLPNTEGSPPAELEAGSSPTPKPYPSILQSVGIVLIFFLFLFGCIPIMSVASSLGDGVALLLYYLAAMGLTFAAVHSIRRRKLGSSPYDFRISSWRLVIPLALCSVALILGVIGPLGNLIPMPDSIRDSFEKFMGQEGFANFVCLVLAAPLLEELIFRGIMLDGLLQRYRPVTAILVSSFLFGAMHLNPWQFITGIVLGIFMGWVYLRTRSVGNCILIHMAANLNGYLMTRAVGFDTGPSGPQGYFESYGGVGVFVSVVGISTLVIAACVIVLRREFDRLDMETVELAVTASGEETG